MGRWPAGPEGPRRRGAALLRMPWSWAWRSPPSSSPAWCCCVTSHGCSRAGREPSSCSLLPRGSAPPWSVSRPTPRSRSPSSPSTACRHRCSTRPSPATWSCSWSARRCCCRWGCGCQAPGSACGFSAVKPGCGRPWQCLRRWCWSSGSSSGRRSCTRASSSSWSRPAPT